MVVKTQIQPHYIVDTETERDVNWADGSRVFCKDTQKGYILLGGEWKLLGPGSGGGGAAWGEITGTLSAQTDLNGAIAQKTTLVEVKADADIADAISKKHASALDHSHSNKAQLDLLTDGDHDVSPHAPPNAQKNSDITKAEIEAKLTGEISSHSHAGGGGEGEIVVVKIGDTANATTSLANAADLSFTAEANSLYIIEVFLLWAASATTVGIKVSASATNSPTITAGHFITDAVNGTPDSSSYNANDVTVTTSASAFTTYNCGKLNAVLKTAGSSSVWQLRFAAETTGTITIKANSVLRYRKVA